MYYVIGSGKRKYPWQLKYLLAIKLKSNWSIIHLHVWNRTRQETCNVQTAEGSPLCNTLQQLSVTEKLVYCGSHGLRETERLAFFLSTKSRLPLPWALFLCSGPAYRSRHPPWPPASTAMRSRVIQWWERKIKRKGWFKIFKKKRRRFRFKMKKQTGSISFIAGEFGKKCTHPLSQHTGHIEAHRN